MASSALYLDNPLGPSFTLQLIQFVFKLNAYVKGFLTGAVQQSCTVTSLPALPGDSLGTISDVLPYGAS